MKVLVCPICRNTPEITSTKLTCPKCGRTAVGKDLTDTVTKWNNGELALETAVPEDEVVPEANDDEVAESFVEDVKAVEDLLPEAEPEAVEEAKAEEVIEAEPVEEPKKPTPKRAIKPVEKTPVKRTTRRGIK